VLIIVTGEEGISMIRPDEPNALARTARVNWVWSRIDKWIEVTPIAIIIVPHIEALGCPNPRFDAANC
jgi:hypothetical protein